MFFPSHKSAIILAIILTILPTNKSLALTAEEEKILQQNILNEQRIINEQQNLRRQKELEEIRKIDRSKKSQESDKIADKLKDNGACRKIDKFIIENNKKISSKVLKPLDAVLDPLGSVAWPGLSMKWSGLPKA